MVFDGSQWGREFRADCDLSPRGMYSLTTTRLNGAANSARTATPKTAPTTPKTSWRLNGAANSARTATGFRRFRPSMACHVSMGPRIPRGLRPAFDQVNARPGLLVSMGPRIPRGLRREGHHPHRSDPGSLNRAANSARTATRPSIFFSVSTRWRSQWGREFRADCDTARKSAKRSAVLRLNGAANSARTATLRSTRWGSMWC